LATAAAALCAFIAPAAAGPGIPEVKAYLNGNEAHSISASITRSIPHVTQEYSIDEWRMTWPVAF